MQMKMYLLGGKTVLSNGGRTGGGLPCHDQGETRWQGSGYKKTCLLQGGGRDKSNKWICQSARIHKKLAVGMDKKTVVC